MSDYVRDNCMKSVFKTSQLPISMAYNDWNNKFRFRFYPKDGKIEGWAKVRRKTEVKEKLTEYKYKFGSYSDDFSLFETNGWSSYASPVK